MKKLMIAAVIVCAAAMSQAAAITWKTGNLVDYTGAKIGGGTAGCTDYTATVYFFKTIAGGIGTQNDISSTFAGTLVDTTADKNGGYQANTKSTGIESGTYYAQVIVEGKGYKLESDIAAFTYDSNAQSAKTIEFLSGTGFDTKQAYLHNTGTNFGWQSVPEPTSGLLLLLGVAGLALRRRRA